MKQTKNKYETFCPLFPGFYGTIFEYDNEESDIDSYNQENETDLSYDDFEWNYKDYSDRVANAFVCRLETELNHFLPIKIEFQKVHSPKEYNFYNDSINVSIKVNLKQLIGLIKERKEQATQYFKDKYTSCSGFISFHSNDIEDWVNTKYILENPDHRIGALLECLCTIEIDNDDIYYWADSEYWVDFGVNENVNS